MNHETPKLAVDLVIIKERTRRYLGCYIDDDTEIVVIERHFEPKGHALPGGFVDVGESTEAAAIREAMEETNLKVEICGLIGVFSEPSRDPRRHVVSVAYLAEVAEDSPDLKAGDDAKAARWLSYGDRKSINWCFDHKDIVEKARRVTSP